MAGCFSGEAGVTICGTGWDRRSHGGETNGTRWDRRSRGGEQTHQTELHGKEAFEEGRGVRGTEKRERERKRDRKKRAGVGGA